MSTLVQMKSGHMSRQCRDVTEIDETNMALKIWVERMAHDVVYSEERTVLGCRRKLVNG